MCFATSIYLTKFGKLTNSSGNEWTRRINKKTLENNANIKYSTLNDNNIVNINCKKGKDTDIDLLISKNLRDMNGNSRENRAANQSECRKVDEINLIDFSEPEIVWKRKNCKKG